MESSGGWPRPRAGNAGCRLVWRRSDQGQAAPALAPVFNRVTPRLLGTAAAYNCVVDGQVMIEPYRVLSGLLTAASTTRPCFNYPGPEGGSQPYDEYCGGVSAK
jgi:hypothetical protein